MQGKEADYYKNVIKYRKSLDNIQGVCDDEYEKRLSSCLNCNALTNGTCAHCGCYVEMRAALKKMQCPHPEGNRW